MQGTTRRIGATIWSWVGRTRSWLWSELDECIVRQSEVEEEETGGVLGGVGGGQIRDGKEKGGGEGCSPPSQHAKRMDLMRLEASFAG